MADVDPTGLGPGSVTATTIINSLAAAGTSSGRAELHPASMAANPPKIERAAETEAERARSLSSAGFRPQPAAALAATASAANPDALEANPEAVGKSFCDSTRARSCKPAPARTRSSSATTLAQAAGSCSLPFSTSSSLVALGSNSTRVTVVNAESVMERLGTSGRLSVTSRLPQYLASAMLEWARARLVPDAAAEGVTDGIGRSTSVPARLPG